MDITNRMLYMKYGKKAYIDAIEKTPANRRGILKYYQSLDINDLPNLNGGTEDEI